MSGLVDFALVKERVSFEQALSMLGLEFTERNGQIRLACPHCGGSDRSLVITPSKGLFYCFSSGGKDGGKGDVLSFVSHVLQIPVKEAAQKLAGTYLATSTVDVRTSSVRVPEERRGEETKKLQPLPYLEFDHEAVVVNNLDPRIAQRFGIGFAPKGTARGNVVIPIRDEDGTLHGYLGVEEITFVPKDFQPPDNVVPLKRKA